MNRRTLAVPVIGGLAALAAIVPSTAASAHHKPGHDLHKVTSPAVSFTHDTVKDASAYVDKTADGAGDLTEDTTKEALKATDQTADAAGDTVEGATDAAHKVVHSTVKHATHVAGDAVEDTTEFAGQAVDYAGDTAGAALHTTKAVAGDTVADTGEFAGNTVDAVTDYAVPTAKSVVSNTSVQANACAGASVGTGLLGSSTSTCASVSAH